MTPWVTIPGFNSRTFKMQINVAAGAEYAEMAAGTYDREALHLLLRGKTQNAVVWDIGAHTGYASLMLTTDWSVREVHAFEPHPGNAARIREHFDANTTCEVTVHELALSDRDGVSELWSFPDVDALQSTGGYLDGVTPPLDAACYGGFCSCPVVLRTGDSLVESGLVRGGALLPVPDIVKVDVEGAELRVLEGASHTFGRRLPMILLEVHSAELQKSCETLLKAWGYRVQTIRILGGGRAHLLASA